MKMLRLLLCLALVFSLTATAAFAQDKEMKKGEGEMKQGAMPQMGPNEEMKKAAKSMVGTWDFAGKMWMDETQAWVDVKATAVFSTVAGGVGLIMDYTMPMPGPGPFKGFDLACYNKETGQWEEVWTDNMSGYVMMMTGHEKDGKRVMNGTFDWEGKTWQLRQTSYDMTDTSIKWKMERSADGKNWQETMIGTYTKKM